MHKSVDAEEDVSLFPFLSVLACIIGTLTLIIATQAVTQLDNKAVVAADEYEKISQRIAATKSQLNQLSREFQSKQAVAAELNQQEQERVNTLQKQHLSLTQQLEKAMRQEAETKTIVLPEFDAVRQREDLEKLQKQLMQVAEIVAQLEKEIEERKLPPEESHISVLPTGSGVGYTPYFAECATNRIVVHSSSENYSVLVSELGVHAQYLEMLTQIKAEADSTLVFLIREDGLETYYKARNQANQLNINHGKLPVVGKGRIDLGYFFKKKQ